MGNGLVEVTFFDSWVWLIFIVVGLVLVLMELIIGIETGLDLVFIGTAFILGGLITLSMGSWVWTAITTGIIGVLYIVVGRRYVHNRIAATAEKTNIDTIIGKKGVIQKAIMANNYGLVKIGAEQWRAGSDEEIGEGEEIVVDSVKGATLYVRKTEGGK